jgi:hypothetical protein
LVTDYLTQAMTAQASEFDISAALDNVQHALLPWLGEAAPRIKKEHHNQRLQELDAEEAERRQEPVPLPFPIDATGKQFLKRDPESLLIVGWRPAVMYVLEQLCRSTEDTRYNNVLRLTVFSPAPERNVPERVLEFIDWAQCAKTNDSLMEYLSDKSTKAAMSRGKWLQGKMDLLVVDDILQAGPKSIALAGSTGTTVSLSTVNNSIRRCRAFVKHVGACPVIGLPLPDRNPPDLGHAEIAAKWSDLLAHNLVRRVYVREDGDDYILTLESSRHEFRVPKSKFSPSLIKE